MNHQYWSYLLTFIGVLGAHLAGKKNPVGWLIGFGVQFLWVAYATVTHQTGFYFGALFFGLVYGKNFLAWHKSEKETQRMTEAYLEALDNLPPTMALNVIPPDRPPFTLRVVVGRKDGEK